ncbi:MAG TPA: SusC/RagA family TonB-linked outer membrane protein [Bacteroidales bacterium]|nr:SusC/RagA family TonB-linked outer membrane protein [Bacteroidales bacterium]
MGKSTQLLLLFLTFSLLTSAQQMAVTGTVTSSEDGSTLPGVSILIKGTSTGTTTDINGKYALSRLSSSNILVFSFLGYEKQEITVRNQSVINVVMKPAATRLEEVVVTALGVKRQKREIGYSTEKIETKQIANAGAPNIINALAGRSAGVMVSQGDGVDGGTTRITIRGNNNLGGNNEPLIVVDNVPLENTEGLTDIGRGVDWGNGISDLNSLDIEEYSVLKGGAASALYGSRGANGVILITTKRGKKQSGLGITYNFEEKITHPYRYREVQNKYGAGGPVSFTEPAFPVDENGILQYPGVYGNDKLVINQEGKTSSTSEEFGYYGSSVSWGPEMKGQLVKWWDGEMRNYSPQPDNFKEPYQDGFTRTHNIEATGGSEKGTLRISLTRQDHKPIIRNSNYDRTTINVGTTINISEKVKADAVLTYVRFNRLNSPILGEDQNSFNKGYLYSWPRSYQNLDLKNYQLADGSQNKLDGYPFLYVDRYLWWDYYNNNTQLSRDKYTGSLALSYAVTPWLNFTGRAGRDYVVESKTATSKPTDVIGLLGGSYSNELSKCYNDNFDLILTAEKKMIFNSPVTVKFTAGANRWDYNYYSIYGHSGTWYYPNMYTFFNYTETNYVKDENGQIMVEETGDALSKVATQEGISRIRNNSVYSFLNFAYKDYLFLEFTARNDWSSTLPSYSNSFIYPSVSASYIASEALQLQKHLPWLNFLKIRGGISQTASGGNPYQAHFYYTTSFFGGDQTSYFPSRIPPYRLKPQRVNSYEAGVNIGLFENRIDIDFTWYYKYSFDQILDLPVPVSSGAPGISINEGTLSNRGVELIINTVPVQTNNLIIKAGFNFARNRNKIVSLGDYSDTYLLAEIWGLNGPAIALKEGDDYGTIVGYDYLYNDKGERILNDEGTKFLITDNRVPVGNASPDFTGAVNADISWKGLRLSALVDTKWGGDIYCGSYVISLQTGQSPSTLLERDGGGLPYTDPEGNVRNVGVILDGVYADGTKNTKVVHYYYKYLPNAGGWGKFISKPGILENTWVKMREISLSYRIPESLTKKIKVFQALTINLTGRDLFYIYTTLPDKINPEGIMGSGNAQGFEWASYPSTQSFSFGVNASF